MFVFKSLICLMAMVILTSSCCEKCACEISNPYGWQSGEIVTNGIRIHYYRTGNGTQPPMVLLHGYTDNGLCWTDMAHELETEYDIIMMDYRGHGFSDAPQTGYKIEDYTVDVIGLIEGMKLKKPILIGHSMGGSIAATIALTWPDMIQKAVLIDPPGVAKPLFETQAKKNDARLFFQNDMQFLKKADYATLLHEAAKRHPLISNQARCRWADSKLQARPQIIETVLGLPDLTDQWANMTVPVLILKADADKKTKREELDAVKDAPNVTLIHIPGSTHLVHLDKPEATMKELQKFLAE